MRSFQSIAGAGIVLLVFSSYLPMFKILFPKQTNDNEEPNSSRSSPSFSATEQYRPLDPVTIFEDYKRYHSVEALQRDPNAKDRKFIAAHFSCPHQAGIQTAIYLNALLLAIATNRTLLYSYDGVRTYIKRGQNAPEVCERILRRADWIPLQKDYDLADVPTRRINATVHRDSGNKLKSIKSMIDQGLEAHENIGSSQLIEPDKLWGLGEMEGYWHGLINLTEPYASAYYTHAFGIESNLADDKRIQRLYAEGPYFLYGMLFSESFSFTDEFLETASASFLPETGKNVFSIGLHSRHTSDDDPGEGVIGETTCIDILFKQYTKNKECRLYLMSDREVTIAKITNHTTEKHPQCQVITASGRQKKKGKTNLEHGVYAGEGFFHDLAVVSRAESAFVARKRSSSALLASLMDYNRRIKAWRKNGTRGLPDMLKCGI